jgi:hypothetical protein
MPKRVSQTITTPKMMLTVLLGAEGVVFMDWLPTEERFNSGCFCVHVLRPLAEILHRRRGMHSARAIVHFAMPLRIEQLAVNNVSCYGFLSHRGHVSVAAVHSHPIRVELALRSIPGIQSESLDGLMALYLSGVHSSIAHHGFRLNQS